MRRLGLSQATSNGTPTHAGTSKTNKADKADKQPTHPNRTPTPLDVRAGCGSNGCWVFAQVRAVLGCF